MHFSVEDARQSLKLMAYIFAHDNDTRPRLLWKIAALVVFYPFIAITYGTFVCLAQLSDFLDRFKAVGE